MSKKELREIVVELGIDPDILGESRVNGLKTMTLFAMILCL